MGGSHQLCSKYAIPNLNGVCSICGSLLLCPKTIFAIWVDMLCFLKIYLYIYIYLSLSIYIYIYLSKYIYSEKNYL